MRRPTAPACQRARFPRTWRPRTKTALLPCLLGFSGVACGLDAPACSEPTARVASAIKYASEDAGIDTDPALPVLVAVLHEGFDGRPGLACTASRVAPGVALTAMHCVRDVGEDETIWGIRLEGELPEWVSAKDVLLELLRRHGVSGGQFRSLASRSRRIHRRGRRENWTARDR